MSIVLLLTSEYFYRILCNCTICSIPICNCFTLVLKLKHLAQKEDVATSTDDSDFDNVLQISQTSVRRNSHGQVKTSRNVKCPKPPLPPMKRTPKAPLRRSARNIEKHKSQVNICK